MTDTIKQDESATQGIAERMRSNQCPENTGCGVMPKCACAEMDDGADIIDELVGALEKADEALRTWVATYAPDECTEQNVADAKARLSEGGPLWYIATANKQIRTAIAKARGEADTTEGR